MNDVMKEFKFGEFAFTNSLMIYTEGEARLIAKKCAEYENEEEGSG